MLSSVRDYRSFALETMRNSVLSVFRLINFSEAILKQLGELLLKQLQGLSRRLDSACPTLSFGNFERCVFDRSRLLEKNIGERGRLESQ